MDIDDSILLRRWLSERDTDAFVLVAMRHAKMVYGVALRILGNSQDAEEIAQESFEMLAGTKSVPVDNLTGWLYQIAATQAQKRIHSEHQNQALKESYQAPAIVLALPPEPDVSWNDVYRYVDEAILALPDIHRDPLIAHFFEQESQELIAQRLGLARSSVSHRIQQGIETVRRDLKKRGIPLTVAAMGTWFDAQATALSVPSARLAERIARIGVSGIGGATVKGDGPSAKWVAGGIAVLVLVALGVFLNSKPTQSPESAPVLIPPVSSDKVKDSITPPAVDSPKTEVAATPESKLPTATPVAEDPLASLWGFWSTEATVADKTQHIGTAEIRLEKGNIVISGLGRSLVLIGPVRGLQLQMRFSNNSASEQVALSGTFAPGVASFTLTGTISDEGESRPLVLVFTRLKGSALTAELRKAEVDAIYSALEEYKKNFGGLYPDRLEDVARFFKGDVALLTSSPGRKIIYQPKTPIKPEAYFSDTMLQGDNETQYADLIVAAEARMHETGVYNFLFHPALVTVIYSSPVQRIVASSSGRVIEEGDDAQLSEMEAAERRAACQNNLKQLGLVQKMFANEHNDFISGGWAMVYPEYVTDTAILSCPCRPMGDDSYMILFPAVSSNSFCMELCGKVTGGSVDSSMAQSMVPMVVESFTHTANGKQGRNVLFFDGHVEFVQLSDLPAKVDRFVKANR